VDTDGVRHCIDQLRIGFDLRRWPAEALILCALAEIGIKTRFCLASAYDAPLKGTWHAGLRDWAGPMVLQGREDRKKVVAAII